MEALGCSAAPETASLRALIVDSHPLVSWALADYLTDCGWHAPAILASGVEVVAALRAESVDAVVLDAALPEVGSGRLLGQLRSLCPHLAVVVLNGTRGAATTRDLAVSWGGTCYLSPDAAPDDVVAALHATVSKARLVRKGARRPARPVHEPVLTLSAREQQVLELLRDGHSLPSVAATLHISMSTTKTYVARLYDKLGTGNRTEALMRALRLGLLRTDTDAPALTG